MPIRAPEEKVQVHEGMPKDKEIEEIRMAGNKNKGSAKCEENCFQGGNK